MTWYVWIVRSCVCPFRYISWGIVGDHIAVSPGGDQRKRQKETLGKKDESESKGTYNTNTCPPMPPAAPAKHSGCMSAGPGSRPRHSRGWYG